MPTEPQHQQAAQGAAGPPVESDAPDVLVENLYKKNVELSVKNKTLSLLSKLYDIGIQTLAPKDLATHIVQTVQQDLSFELVGIYLFVSEQDLLEPLMFAKSEKLTSLTEKEHFLFQDVPIPHASQHPFFGKVLSKKSEHMTNNLVEVWNKLLQPAVLASVLAESNIKTTLLHPLMVEDRVLGIILFALNRDYDTLSPFEQESENSIVNIIALSLEKAFLYRKLEDANRELKELDRQKDELLSIVSHQLAAPVTALKWYTEILLDGEVGQLTPEQQTQIETMRGVTTNLSDLVSMILDVSRIQLGRMHIEQQKLDFAELCTEILQVVTPKATQKQQDFVVTIQQNLPTVYLDKRLTRMTIENLLTNAVKYTPEKGKVTFTVNAQDGMLHIEVADTGCGIPQEEQDKIFGKLFRASNVRNSVEGNGFGLYVAKGSVENQGGKIRFVSQEGKGTTFMVDLPVGKAPEEK